MLGGHLLNPIRKCVQVWLVNQIGEAFGSLFEALRSPKILLPNFTAAVLLAVYEHHDSYFYCCFGVLRPP